jgi:hypothetical protein
MKKVLRLLLKIILAVSVVLLTIFLVFYLQAPVYKFSGPSVFSGSKLYNPYQNMDAGNWRKYNFQVQSRVWGGLTDGRKNTNELIDSIYNQLGFDHVATSDYQQINYYGSHKPDFIPTYEHGYNIFKTHQVCIGAEKVLWTDLMFFQTLSMKQWILDMLKKDSRIVAMAHPLLRNGYSVDEMKYLSNYQLMEVLNNVRLSFGHWDMALSSGHPVWMLANDDAHDVVNSNEVGRRFTMINSPTTRGEDILDNLEKGNAYGFDFIRHDDEPMETKYERSKHIPHLVSAKLCGDTLIIEVSKKAESFKFIGQGGKTLQTNKKAKTAQYVIKPADTYVRTEIMFADKSGIYLNPIVRYEGNSLQSKLTSEIDKTATLLLRLAYLVIAVLLVVVCVKRRRKRKKA